MARFSASFLVRYRGRDAVSAKDAANFEESLCRPAARSTHHIAGRAVDGGTGLRYGHRYSMQLYGAGGCAGRRGRPTAFGAPASSLWPLSRSAMLPRTRSVDPLAFHRCRTRELGDG
jgi:hypothetical protein